MNLTGSKKTLALAGVICGLVAACLAYFGNPANMAFCIACFIRDTAGAMGMHQAEVCKTRDYRSGSWCIYYFNCDKRIPLYRWIFTDDSFCTWCDHYDRSTRIPGMPTSYGTSYVSR